MEMQSELDIREGMEHVHVAIQTPRGTWPTEGFFEVPAEQKVELMLSHAKASLNIEDTANWVAISNGKQLDPSQSYRTNDVLHQIVILYGPAETE